MENEFLLPFVVMIKRGTIKILVQTLGYSTLKLSLKEEGDALEDFVGPLGIPTDLTKYENILLIGGGIGIAVIILKFHFYIPLAKVDVIIGARTRELLMYDEPIAKASKNLYMMTDDGSYGEKGFVTAKLEELLKTKTYDVVMTVGPVMMMKAVCDITKKANIKTIISMNSIMVDGTGMCGCCRVTVDGKTKYACVDGPEVMDLRLFSRTKKGGILQNKNRSILQIKHCIKILLKACSKCRKCKQRYKKACLQYRKNKVKNIESIDYC